MNNLMQRLLLLILSTALLSACVYRLDIQQGNIIAQKDVDKLRSGLTKNQVKYVLGTPVVRDSFSDNDWHYLYTYKRGKTGELVRKELNLHFEGDSLVSAEGNFQIPESLGGAANSKVEEDPSSN